MTFELQARSAALLAIAAALVVSLAAPAALPAQPGIGRTPAGADSSDVRNLPVIEVPSRRSAPSTLVILLTGDGGWADLARQIADVLAERGVAVVGLNSRAYLSERKTPAQVAADVERLAKVYGARWGTRRLALVGYSRGASMVPFVAARLSPDVRRNVGLLVMLGLSSTANFQFHWADLVRDVRRDDDVPVKPELERLRSFRTLCVYGALEKDSACRDSAGLFTMSVARQGDHHFDRDYRALGDLILGQLPPALP